MSDVWDALRGVDRTLTGWMARHGVTLLRVSVAIVFLWFGALKFFPGVSPAEELAVRTIGTLTGGAVPPHVARPALAALECAIGFGLLLGRPLRATLFLLWMQMAGTVTPLVLFPQETFVIVPFVPTLEGQYIIKNLVLISAGIVIGATARGGGLASAPTVTPAQERARA